jgi:hypothetical protein
METTKGNALVLRTCKSDMTSRNDFVWPASGPVECPDWVASKDCGNGLHGALWGEGDGGLFNWDKDAVWQVVEIEEYIDLEGKVKFPRGIVVHTGDQLSATKYISDNGAKGAIIGGTATAGNDGTATAGDDGTATAGNGGTATAGYRGTATAGYRGTATAGEYGTATAGYRGTATAGNGGTATAGEYGTATAGEYGTATAGYRGTIQIKHWDGERYRIKTAYVGENGIKANTPYKLDRDGDFIKAVDNPSESV